MSNIVYIPKSRLSELKGFYEVQGTLSRADIATLVDVMSMYLESETSDRLSGVVVNREGYFVLVVDGEDAGEFDFYSFLNLYKPSSSMTVTCVNAKLLFPEELSRGIYSGEESGTDSMSDEDESTGYMDEEELGSILQGENLYLVHKKSGREVGITKKGVTVGRSSKKSEFVISGNTNMSRLHCRLYKDGNRSFIKDESANGTFVNGEKVGIKGKVLTAGDVVMMADEEFEVVTQ